MVGSPAAADHDRQLTACLRSSQLTSNNVSASLLILFCGSAMISGLTRSKMRFVIPFCALKKYQDERVNHRQSRVAAGMVAH
jgi:hypothetical protein